MGATASSCGWASASVMVSDTNYFFVVLWLWEGHPKKGGHGRSLSIPFGTVPEFGTVTRRVSLWAVTGYNV